MLPSNDVIREHAYLVSRGVRPMSLVCAVEAEPKKMREVYEKLSGLAPINGGGQGIIPIPFVIAWKGKEMANCGFATHSWIPETLRWLEQIDEQRQHIDRIIGLLLGYSPGAIAAYDVFRSGKLFQHGIEESFPDLN